MKDAAANSCEIWTLLPVSSDIEMCVCVFATTMSHADEVPGEKCVARILNAKVTLGELAVEFC